MKPFNLERALAGDPVVTRDGEPVTQLHVFDCDIKHSLFGVCNGEVLNWTEAGIMYAGVSSSNDLFMAPKIQKQWTVVWINKIGMGCIGDTYDNKEMAEEETKASRYGHKGYVIPIEWSE